MNKFNSEPVIKEVIIDAPISKVWQALTDKDKMKDWYFDLTEFEPKVGFEFKFYGGKDERQYLHLCRITEVKENEKISYSWKYDGYKGESFVSFELFYENGKTLVRLTHSGLETFPADNPDFAKENFIDGWNYIIEKSLKEYAEEK
ncbi:MAG: SRPBCC domain-containing protein [Bacteroidetes bacterium]|nr:SRPBCC domain-containing protein [Bacteroidota bacterium]